LEASLETWQFGLGFGSLAWDLEVGNGWDLEVGNGWDLEVGNGWDLELGSWDLT
jgi:hypothetical protein